MSTDPFEFTVDQLAAIRRLESALKACESAGLSLCGMDDSLTAYPTTMMIEAHEAGAESAYDEQKYCMERGASHHVIDHGAYRDSGGW